MTRTSRVLPPGKIPGDLLQRLIETYRTPSDDSVLVSASYGFDAAAIEVGGETLVIKSDPITFATSDAARYLVAVNANDIACMGGIPKWMTVVGLLPDGTTTPESVEQLFSELHDACVAEDIMLVGGHSEITIGLDRPLLVGTLLGTTGEDGILAPGQASIGDELYLTESAGLEGTALLASELSDRLRKSLGDRIVTAAESLLEDPGISITRHARIALGTGRVTALHDPTEGGVATAIHEVAGASGLGARIDEDAIPVRPETEAIARELELNPLGILSSGALLIATSPGSESTMRDAFGVASIPIARIGTLTKPEEHCTIVRQGATSPLPRFDSDEIARALQA